MIENKLRPVIFKKGGKENLGYFHYLHHAIKDGELVAVLEDNMGLLHQVPTGDVQFTDSDGYNASRESEVYTFCEQLEFNSKKPKNLKHPNRKVMLLDSISGSELSILQSFFKTSIHLIYVTSRDNDMDYSGALSKLNRVEEGVVLIIVNKQANVSQAILKLVDLDKRLNYAMPLVKLKPVEPFREYDYEAVINVLSEKHDPGIYLIKVPNLLDTSELVDAIRALGIKSEIPVLLDNNESKREILNLVSSAVSVPKDRAITDLVILTQYYTDIPSYIINRCNAVINLCTD